MARTSGVLEFAVLGLLHDSPMHGYELRKRLSAELGTFRAFSYGSLYPALKTLVADGLITQDDADATSSRRSKIVYRLTADGKERFQTLVSEAGPSAWEDDSFSVHLAFFGRTDADVRLRILEGRRSRLEERVDSLRTSLRQAGERVDSYTLALQEHGLDSVEREVRWLNELIKTERDGTGESGRASRTTGATSSTTRTTGRTDTGSRARTTQPQDAPVAANKE
jgi:DNA-binding PadR family transcriptional regulator